MKTLLRLAPLAVLLSSALWGQAQPRPKSQNEAKALQAIFQAQDPDGRISASEEFLTKFADSDFKAFVLMVEAEMYSMKNDPEKTIIYAERTLEADPKNYRAMVLLAKSTASRTKEFDLDRDEKLARIDKYAKGAIEALKTAAKPNPQMPDDQWEQLKKAQEAEAHEAMGMGAMARKDYNTAITEFKAGADLSPEPALSLRLAGAYVDAGKYDEAIALLNQVSANPNLNPAYKPFIENQKQKAEQGKAKAAGAAKK